MQHPIFKKQEKDNIEEELVTEDNVDEIFDNPDINANIIPTSNIVKFNLFGIICNL